MRAKSVLISLLITAGCASGSPASRTGPIINRPYSKSELADEVSDSIRECFERADSQAYLARIHQRIIEEWDVPYGTAHHEIKLALTLDPTGTVTDLTVIQSPGELYSRKALNAVRSAQPFDALPVGSLCLAGLRLNLRFETQFRY